MASKAIVIKFAKQDKASYKGKVGHTRTGACTCRYDQTCQHGRNYSVSKGRGGK